MALKLILMLEDDADDRYITQTAISESGLDVELKFFSNSNEFLDFVNGGAKASLILIDYNSAPDNGVDVLKKLKNRQAINHVPVIILSDSNWEKYRTECYANGASSFIQKPQTVQATADKIETFFKYWLTVAEV